MSKQEKQSKEDIAQAMKSIAVNQAMTEVMEEHKEEILKRARAKLVAMGVDIAADITDCGAV